MPPPPPQPAAVGMAEPTAFQKMKVSGMGALMGSTVGLTIGFIFGGFSIIRAGPGPRGVMGTLSQYMLSSAATFGFFMSIGSVIRTEEEFRQRRALPVRIIDNKQH
ncbi:Protein MGR2 [Wallemia ichthyophaga EXF-994]|uniref:Protein MGR2 n=2 Tax=Wallemia ichthyophaga TaxID=245174 RepID=R9AFS2_WALI9|nr:Protein MGR2 [Wallemia ichthyophaga EXF-994]EOQ98895.1 Protein MGR2 [Wallemia ichthyophaga EXF-994]